MFEDEDDVTELSMAALMATEEEKKKKEEERAARREEEEKKRQEAGEAAGIQYVSGNLYSLILVLNKEYTKSLQRTDPHAPEYVERLKDEAQVPLLRAYPSLPAALLCYPIPLSSRCSCSSWPPSFSPLHSPPSFPFVPLDSP